MLFTSCLYPVLSILLAIICSRLGRQRAHVPTPSLSHLPFELFNQAVTPIHGKTMLIGFIGSGKIAQALIKGFLKAGTSYPVLTEYNSVLGKQWTLLFFFLFKASHEWKMFLPVHRKMTSKITPKQGYGQTFYRPSLADVNMRQLYSL